MSGSNGFCWFYVQQNVVIEANSLRFDNISKYADHRAGTILLLTVSLVWTVFVSVCGRSRSSQVRVNDN